MKSSRLIRLVLSVFLILGNAAIPMWRYLNHDSPNVTDLIFHGLMIFIGVAIYDSAKAKEIISDLKDVVPFMRKGS